MKYPRFGILAFVLGTAAIVGSLFVPSTTQIIPAEIVAQLLLILILAGALRWGRNGGFVTALIAIAIYVGMRYPQLSAEGLSADVVTMIVSRALAYTIIGLVGGELAGRLKYLLTRVERDVMIDPVTRVYSARYAGRAIVAALGKYRRYETPCTVLTLAISPQVWSGLKTARMNSLMRRVASYLRNDVRMMDDVAYRGNGGFLVILPETPAEGAAAAIKRLHSGVAASIGCETSAIAVQMHACGTDDVALEELAAVLSPETGLDDGSPASATLPADRRMTERTPENA